MKTSGVTRAVVSVGSCRGFIIAGPHGRLIVTAASCLPWSPIFSPIRSGEGLCSKLIAELGKEPRIGATCLFADWVANIAVLGPPLGHPDEDEVARFDALVNAGKALPIAPASNGSGSCDS